MCVPLLSLACCVSLKHEYYYLLHSNLRGPFKIRSTITVGQAKMVHKMVPKKAIFSAILWRVLLDPVLV
jgi:hypothetical protein